MTAAQTPGVAEGAAPGPHIKPPVPFLNPVEGSRLEQLAAQYGEAKKLADASAKALKVITDGIKLELTNAAPGLEAIDLVSPLLARPLRMSSVTSWRVDTEKLKTQYTEVYARCAKESTAWKLAEVGVA